jgi:hypothetical protein
VHSFSKPPSPSQQQLPMMQSAAPLPHHSVPVQTPPLPHQQVSYHQPSGTQSYQTIAPSHLHHHLHLQPPPGQQTPPPPPPPPPLPPLNQSHYQNPNSAAQQHQYQYQYTATSIPTPPPQQQQYQPPNQQQYQFHPPSLFQAQSSSVAQSASSYASISNSSSHYNNQPSTQVPSQHMYMYSLSDGKVYRPPPNLLPAIPAPPSVRFPPRLQTSQRALLVGCNYVGQSGELKGCGNDVLSIKSLLTKTYGWDDDRDRLLILV